MSSSSTDNIWESLLRESTKNSANSRNNLPSSLIFLGDSNADQNYKSQVISYFSSVKRRENLENQGERVVDGINIVSSGIHVVEYEYFTTDDGNIVNLWTFDANIRGIECKPADLEIFYNKFPNEQILFVIVLDLVRTTSMNPIQVLKKYLYYIKSVSMQLKAKNGAASMSEKEQDILSYLGKVKSLPESETISIHNFGFPIAVVGITPTLTESDQYQELQRLKSWQGQIRKLCIDIGASVVFAPIVMESKESDQAVISGKTFFSGKLKNYLMSRLYQEVSNELQIEVN